MPPLTFSFAKVTPACLRISRVERSRDSTCQMHQPSGSERCEQAVGVDPLVPHALASIKRNTTACQENGSAQRCRSEPPRPG